MNERKWKGLNRAERSAERRVRLINAGVEIMGTAGSHAVTVRGICRATQISERHFYLEFATKDEFLLAVYEDVVGQAFEAMAQVSGEGSRGRKEALHAFLEAWIDFVADDPRRGRIIAVEAAGNRLLAQRGRQVATAMLGRFYSYTIPMVEGRGELASADLEITATVLVTGVWALLLAWLDGTVTADLTRSELVERSVALILRAMP